jgi:membrane-anchored protein YejM (alkaline phosphatase superfamily)
VTLRRIGLACALVALLALFGCGRPEAYKPVNPAAPTTTRAAQPKPNLLVIEADDMRVDELAWMPNTRKLLQKTRGLDFKNSFAPISPVLSITVQLPVREVHPQPSRLQSP